MGNSRITYPSWAPRLLVERHRALCECARQATAKDWALEAELRQSTNVLFVTVREQLTLVEALILNENMKKVWSSLGRRKADFEARRPTPATADTLRLFAFEGTEQQREKFKDYVQSARERSDAIWNDQAMCLLRACEGALLGWNLVPKVSTAVVKTRFLRLAKHADALAALLPQVYWQAIGGNLDFAADTTYPAEGRHITMAEMLRLGGGSPLNSFFVESQSDNPFEGEISPWAYLPGFLERLADLARELAKRPPKMVVQPNAPDNKLHHFVSKLSRYFRRAYGQPLHEQVAAVASAVFSRDVSPENVRRLIKYRARPEEPEKTADK